LHLFDGSEELTAADEKFLAEFAAKKRILICNKADLPRRLAWPAALGGNAVAVSCLTGQGIEELKDAVKELAWSGEIGAEMLETMINSRHQQALVRAREAASRALNALQAQETLELVAMDLRIAANAVGEIVGKTATEDLLDAIFSQFCIGK
jgi:tRNA modification GTPase